MSRNGTIERMSNGWLDSLLAICNPVPIAKAILANHDRLKKGGGEPGSDDWMIFGQQELFDNVRDEWCRITGHEQNKFLVSPQHVAYLHNQFRKLTDDQKSNLRQLLRKNLAVDIIA